MFKGLPPILPRFGSHHGRQPDDGITFIDDALTSQSDSPSASSQRPVHWDDFQPAIFPVPMGRYEITGVGAGSKPTAHNNDGDVLFIGDDTEPPVTAELVEDVLHIGPNTQPPVRTTPPVRSAALNSTGITFIES